jgi:hypothetical protein
LPFSLVLFLVIGFLFVWYVERSEGSVAHMLLKSTQSVNDTY